MRAKKRCHWCKQTIERGMFCSRKCWEDDFELHVRKMDWEGISADITFDPITAKDIKKAARKIGVKL
jgi:hypothetical protein